MYPGQIEYAVIVDVAGGCDDAAGATAVVERADQPERIGITRLVLESAIRAAEKDADLMTRGGHDVGARIAIDIANAELGCVQVELKVAFHGDD